MLVLRSNYNKLNMAYLGEKALTEHYFNKTLELRRDLDFANGLLKTYQKSNNKLKKQAVLRETNGRFKKKVKK